MRLNPPNAEFVEISSGFWDSRVINNIWALHGAVDFPMPNGTLLGNPFTDSVARVTYAGWGDGNTGNMVVLQQGPVAVHMMHLRRALVPLGLLVPSGFLVAESNNTGLSSGPHLHMAVRVDDYATARTIMPNPVLTYGKWAVDPELLLKEDDVGKQDVIDAFREKLPEFGKDAAGNPTRSLLDVTRVSEDYVSSQVAVIEASIARAKGDAVAEAKALEWKAYYDAKINGQPIPPPA